MSIGNFFACADCHKAIVPVEHCTCKEINKDAEALRWMELQGQLLKEQTAELTTARREGFENGSDCGAAEMLGWLLDTGNSLRDDFTVIEAAFKASLTAQAHNKQTNKGIKIKCQ